MAHEIIPPYDLGKFNSETARVVGDRARDILLGGADDVANLAVALHPLVVETLREFGLDGPSNRFNIGGTTAQRVADALYNHLQRSADAQTAAAAHMSAFYRTYMTHVDTPIETVKRLQSQTSARQRLDY